jgi:hypothetical protein
MSVIKRFGNCTIKMYAANTCQPISMSSFLMAHVVRWRIGTLEIIAGVITPRRRLQEPLIWAAANRDLLWVKWKELTGE